MYLAVTTVRDWKCPANKRARRQTRIRLQNYRLRNFEPWGRAPTGEDLFDQDIYLEQSFGFDKSAIHYGLGYVMPYDPLADLIYLNSMKIGRLKMHSPPEKAMKKQRKRKKVNHEPRPADEEEREEIWEGRAREGREPQPEREWSPWTYYRDELEEESWGAWNSY